MARVNKGYFIGVERTLDGKKQNLVKWAAEFGINPSTLYNRLKKWGLRRALTTPVGAKHFSGVERTLDGKTQNLVKWAAEFGVNPSTLYNRLRLGWGLRRALTVPVGKHHTLDGKTQNLVKWAAEFGISHSTLYGRLRLGWGLRRALTTPIDVKRRPRSDSVRKAALAHGLEPDTVYLRMKRDPEMTLTEALERPAHFGGRYLHARLVALAAEKNNLDPGFVRRRLGRDKDMTIEEAVSIPFRQNKNGINPQWVRRPNSILRLAEAHGMSRSVLSGRLKRMPLQEALTMTRAQSEKLRAQKQAAAIRGRGKQITFRGKSQNLNAWAREVGISEAAMYRRIQKWSLRRALMTPHPITGTVK